MMHFDAKFPEEVDEIERIEDFWDIADSHSVGCEQCRTYHFESLILRSLWCYLSVKTVSAFNNK